VMFGQGTRQSDDSNLFHFDSVCRRNITRNILKCIRDIYGQSESENSLSRYPFKCANESEIGSELGEASLAVYTNKKAVHVNSGTHL
jgi:hypothetical protein